MTAARYKFVVTKPDYHVEWFVIVESVLDEAKAAALKTMFVKKLEELVPEALGAEVSMSLADAQYTPDDVQLALMKPISASELMK